MNPEGEHGAGRLVIDFPVCIAMPVWGQDYVRMLLDYCLPSLLSTNNIPAIVFPQGSILAIVTTDEDWKLIKDSPAVLEFSQYIDVMFIPKVTPAVPGSVWRRHHYQSACFDAAKKYFGNQGVILYFNPDGIYSDGAIRSMLARVVTGATVVVGWGPRISDTTSRGHISDGLETFRCGRALILKPRDAVRLMLAHIHPDTLRQAHDSKQFPLEPYMCVWFAPPGKGLIAHVLSVHPYAIDYRRLGSKDVSIFESGHLDSEYLYRIGIQSEDIYLISDSDEGVVLSITQSGISGLVSADRAVPIVNRYFDASLRWKAWSRYTTPLNRVLFKVGIFFHVDDLDQFWEQQAKESADFCGDLVASGGRPDLGKYAEYLELYASPTIMFRLLRRWFWRRLRRRSLSAVRRLMPGRSTERPV